jgi:hypothetical protein
MGFKKYIDKAKYIVKQKNGFMNLAARAVKFVVRPIFVYEKYHLVSYDLASVNSKSGNIKGDTSNTKVITVKNNNEYEKLTSGNMKFQAFFNENNFMQNYRLKFDTGGLLYVLIDLKENEIICSNWISLNPNAFKSMNTSHYSIDFNKEVYLGGWYTNQKCRGLGYNKYLTIETSKYLSSIGKTRWKTAISKNNASSMRSAKALGVNIYGETTHLRVLMFSRWKEVIFQ